MLSADVFCFLVLAHAVLAQYWRRHGAVYKTLTQIDPNHQALTLSINYQWPIDCDAGTTSGQHWANVTQRLLGTLYAMKSAKAKTKMLPSANLDRQNKKRQALTSGKTWQANNAVLELRSSPVKSCLWKIRQGSYSDREQAKIWDKLNVHNVKSSASRPRRQWQRNPFLSGEFCGKYNCLAP